MSNTTDNVDGKRAIEATRADGDISASALSTDLHSIAQQDVQQTGVQKIAAVASALSSAASTPTGTPAAKRSNVSATPIHIGDAGSLMQQQQAMMMALQNSEQTVG